MRSATVAVAVKPTPNRPICRAPESSAVFADTRNAASERTPASVSGAPVLATCNSVPSTQTASRPSTPAAAAASAAFAASSVSSRSR